MYFHVKRLFPLLFPPAGHRNCKVMIRYILGPKNNDLLLQSCQSTTAGMCNRDKLSKLVSYSRGTFWTFWTPCVIYQCFLFKIMKLAESLNNFWIGPHQFNLAESLNNRSTLKSFLSVSIFFFFQAHMFYLKLTPHTEHIYLAVKMLLS